jgi:predicted N-formylglutamate amidohydrolase
VQSHAINQHSDHSGVLRVNPGGRGNLVVTCEHATNVIPDEYANLGLDHNARHSHIAWDLGALAVALELSAKFDAPLIAPGVSRLVFDCNRSPDAENAVLENSEGCDIPGNFNLSLAERQDRARRFHLPFHDALSTTLDDINDTGRNAAFLSIHSFTPVYSGTARDVDLGILHDDDTRLADALYKVAANDDTLVVRKNEPYDAADGVTYTLGKHAVPRGLPNVMIEIRNDLIEDTQGQLAMAKRLARYLEAAFADLGGRNNDG